MIKLSSQLVFIVSVSYEAHAREILMSKECGTVNTSQNGSCSV